MNWKPDITWFVDRVICDTPGLVLVVTVAVCWTAVRVARIISGDDR